MLWHSVVMVTLTTAGPYCQQDLYPPLHFYLRIMIGMVSLWLCPPSHKGGRIFLLLLTVTTLSLSLSLSLPPPSSVPPFPLTLYVIITHSSYQCLTSNKSYHQSSSSHLIPSTHYKEYLHTRSYTYMFAYRKHASNIRLDIP